MSAWFWTLRVAALLGLLFLSAKTHGRQVRLLRERHGVARVDFRKDNGPIVEQIWRQDRWVFLGTFGMLATLGELFVLFGALNVVDLVGYGVLFLGLAFCGGFAVAGLWALARGLQSPANQIHPRTAFATAGLWLSLAAAWAIAFWLLWK